LRTLFRGRVHGIAGEASAVLVDGAVISWVGRGDVESQFADEVIQLEPGELLAPGFIDLQVNGFGGHDAAEGRDAIEAIAGALPATGVTAFLPTLISAPVRVGAEFAAAVRAADGGGARVLGAHIEGPFINPSFRGAHDRACLSTPTEDEVEVIARAGPRLVTLAPELPGGLEAIRRLRRAGVVVSAGHTGADFEQGQRAIEAGVRFGTHVYNAMPPVHHRRPGIALALILDRRVTVGLIADGMHVHPSVCRQLLAVKGGSRIALTTDQTAAAGTGPGAFQLSGRRVVSDGVVVRLEDGTLAGSASTMDDLVGRVARLPGMNVEKAVTLASTVPARVLGERELGHIGLGACADLVVLDKDMRVRLTMVDGRVRFRR
jgi:N-acetylglucosamine-6-phosphate deacetylase